MTKKRKRSARSRALPWIAAAGVVLVALWLLLTNAVFVVRDVQVVGSGEIPESDVRRLSGIRLGSRIFSVDESRVQLNVESDGRVAFVGLSRRLPNRVVLTVRPRTKDAVILQGGKILVLDSDAYVVSVTDRVPDANAVYVTGLRASTYMLGRQLDTSDGRCGCMKAVLEALKAKGATAYAAELNVSDTANLKLITRTGMTVLLGSSENMENKVAWMAGALADLEARGETDGQLDVSSATKADYAPAPVEETPEPEPTPIPTPTGEVYSIDGVVYVNGVPVDAEATEAPAS